MPAPDSVPLVELAGASKVYLSGRRLGRRGVGIRAVDGVTLSIDAGETLGVVGESGCGKSTLAGLLMGLITPTGGTVRYRAQLLRGRTLKEYRRHAQMVFQDPYSSLDPRMTVRRSVEEPLRIHTRLTGRQRSEAAAEVLSHVGLDVTALDRYPHQFSGGERQRITIARAMILRPQLLVCDEPVSALDVSVQAQILNLLLDLKAEFGLTTVFVSHDMGVVRHVSDRVAVMYLGRVVEIGSRSNLFERPEHPYTRGLLAAAPRLRRHDRSAPAPIAGEVPSPADPPPGCGFQTRCPVVMPVCRREIPPLQPRRTGHHVACHLDNGDPASIGDAA
ncbi:ABC transporter ATP-binding protein [Dactylosporangium sp. CA-233914]|uniref:ABC transporter ATP-binding protein n=1 Tax=Dactylosporangium sp. CA-233914 TaxID=3239934 RepID=UPI003D927BC8